MKNFNFSINASTPSSASSSSYYFSSSSSVSVISTNANHYITYKKS